MPPKGWASDPQAELLTSYIPLYETYQNTTKRYQPFWDVVNAAYLQQWPILPPGVKVDDLDEVAFQVYSDQLNKLYSRIKEWYRWRRNSRSRTTTKALTSKEIKDIYSSGSRNAKEYEVFVKQNLDTFQPVYQAECKSQGASGRAKLPIWHKVAGELWEKSTEETKAAVQAELAAAKQAKPEDDDPCTPIEYQKHWEKLPAILSKTVAPAVRKAGVLAFVTLVGPVPKAGGQILATTLQIGDKPETPLFSNTWADHDHILINQLASFAGRYEFYVCAKRSLGHRSTTDDAPLDAPGSSRGTAGGATTSTSDGAGGSESDPTSLTTAFVSLGTPSTNHTGGQPQSEVPSEVCPPSTTPSVDPQGPIAANGTININGSFDLSKYDPTNFDIPSDWEELDWDLEEHCDCTIHPPCTSF
ncbi:hypothetical protein H1R20_g15504, partial [Candolleomyces eurysporus]